VPLSRTSKQAYDPVVQKVFDQPGICIGPPTGKEQCHGPQLIGLINVETRSRAERPASIPCTEGLPRQVNARNPTCGASLDQPLTLSSGAPRLPRLNGLIRVQGSSWGESRQAERVRHPRPRSSRLLTKSPLDRPGLAHKQASSFSK
jgi:hypothetical protein